MSRRRLLLAIIDLAKYVATTFTNLYYSLINGKKKAKFVEYQGNSVVENQLVNTTGTSETINGITFTNNGDGSWTISGTANATIYKPLNTCTTITGHMFLIIGANSQVGMYVYDKAVVYTNTVFAYNGSTINNYVLFYIANGTAITTPITIIPQLIDLTQKYPFDTPTTLTDNRVLSILNRGYIPYNTGSIENTRLGVLGSEPYNLFDGVWESYSSSQVQSSNFTKIIPNMSYTIESGVSGRILLYDENKTFYDYYSLSANGSRTLTLTCKYVKFRMDTTDINNNSICFHRTGTRTGYAPHAEPSYLTFPATIELSGVGTAHNIFRVYRDKYEFTRNMWEYIFTGSETISVGGAGYQFQGLSSVIKTVEGNIVANALSNIYKIDTLNNVYNGTNDKTFAVASNGRIYFYDSSITSETAMLEKLTGSTIDYQLATPQVISIPKGFMGVYTFTGSETFAGGGSDGIFIIVPSSSFAPKIPTSSSSIANIFTDILMTSSVNGMYSGDMKIGIATNGSILVLNKNFANDMTGFKSWISGKLFFYETATQTTDFNTKINVEYGGTLTGYEDLEHTIECKVLPNVEMEMQQ